MVTSHLRDFEYVHKGSAHKADGAVIGLGRCASPSCMQKRLRSGVA